MTRGLFVGARPPPGRYRWLAVIVLCAREFQPASRRYPGITVLRAPLDDVPGRSLRSDEIDLAISSARTVKRHLESGQRVLVTCAMGLNRSALIAALALRFVYKMGPDEAIGRLRAARGPEALGNPSFRRLIHNIVV